jgi:hypothetical protein
MTFYARWAALGLFTAFWTIISVLIFDGADVLMGVAGMTVAALITARVWVGPLEPRRNYPSTVRSRNKG